MAKATSNDSLFGTKFKRHSLFIFLNYNYIDIAYINVYVMLICICCYNEFKAYKYYKHV